MRILSLFAKLWQRFFPAMRMVTSPTPGDALLEQTLLEQLPNPLPEQGQVMVRMQSAIPGSSRWGDMAGVLMCNNMPTEEQVMAIAGRLTDVINSRGRHVIAQQQVFSDGILMLTMVYAEKIPRGGKNRVVKM